MESSYLIKFTPRCRPRRMARIQTHAPDRTPEQCQPIIAAWLRSGLLSDQDYEDPTQRKRRKGLFVDAGKRPGDVV